MFDIGFAELLLITVVGLLVLGPDKLPGAIRTASLWIGKFKRSLNQIKEEIEREVGVDDIRQQLHNDSVLKELEETKSRMEALRSDLHGIDESIHEATEKQETSKHHE